jgi:hypothetical protein
MALLRFYIPDEKVSFFLDLIKELSYVKIIEQKTVSSEDELDDIEWEEIKQEDYDS